MYYVVLDEDWKYVKNSATTNLETVITRIKKVPSIGITMKLPELHLVSVDKSIYEKYRHDRWLNDEEYVNTLKIQDFMQQRGYYYGGTINYGKIQASRVKSFVDKMHHIEVYAHRSTSDYGLIIIRSNQELGLESIKPMLTDWLTNNDVYLNDTGIQQIDIDDMISREKSNIVMKEVLDMAVEEIKKLSNDRNKK